MLIQMPVYYPFKEVIEDNGRNVVSNDLLLGADNRYHMNFEDFEQKIRENDIKLFLLCSPHNPVGRVWSKEELTRIGDICVRYGVIVVSDKIHNDFIFKGEHTVFANIKEEFKQCTITCTSASKTFNLASMLLSNIFIPNRELRVRFKKQVNAAGISQLGVLGLIAFEAAYQHGEVWYQAMMAYVKKNIEFAKQYVEENLPGVTMIDTEGTYLIWLDFRNTGLNVDELDHMIIYDAKLWLDSGRIFGKAGEGFQRINVACPRSILKDALERIKRVLDS